MESYRVFEAVEYSGFAAALEAEAVVFGACGTVLVLLSVLYMTVSVFCFW
jgi:hypothetical protein